MQTKIQKSAGAIQNQATSATVIRPHKSHNLEGFNTLDWARQKMGYLENKNLRIGQASSRA